MLRDKSEPTAHTHTHLAKAENLLFMLRMNVLMVLSFEIA